MLIDKAFPGRVKLGRPFLSALVGRQMPFRRDCSEAVRFGDRNGDMRLYAYVGDDPINKVDPTGECQTISRDDGTQTHVGVCGNSASAAFVQERLTDPHSNIGKVETLAVERGTLVGVVFSDKDREGGEVNGGKTEQGPRVGDGKPVIVVTIDRSDTALVNGVNANTGIAVTDHVMSTEEIAEHEIAGHAKGLLTGMRGEKNAIAAENEFRAKRGDEFRRVDEYGRIIPR